MEGFAMQGFSELGVLLDEDVPSCWPPAPGQLASSMAQPADWCEGGAASSIVSLGRARGGASGQPHKARLRWTPELHTRFLASANALGGPEVATPKQIMVQMEVPGLTLLHVKSHLQKYRVAIKRSGSSDDGSPKGGHASGGPGRRAAGNTAGDAGQGKDSSSCEEAEEQEEEEEGDWQGAAAIGEQLAGRRLMDCTGRTGAGFANTDHPFAAIPEEVAPQLQAAHAASSPDSAEATWELRAGLLQASGGGMEAALHDGPSTELAGPAKQPGGPAGPGVGSCHRADAVAAEADGLGGSLCEGALAPCADAPCSPAPPRRALPTAAQLSVLTAQGPGLQPTPQVHAGLQTCSQQQQEEEGERVADGLRTAAAGSTTSLVPSDEEGEGDGAYVGRLERALAAQVEMQRELQGALEAQRQLQEKLLTHGEFIRALVLSRAGSDHSSATTTAPAPGGLLHLGEGYPRPLRSFGKRGHRSNQDSRRARTGGGKRAKSNEASAAASPLQSPVLASLPLLAPDMGDLATEPTYEAWGLAAALQPGWTALGGRHAHLQQQQQQQQVGVAGWEPLAGALPVGAGLPGLAPEGRVLHPSPSSMAAPTAQQPQQQWAQREAGCSAGFRIDPGEVLARLTRGLPIHRLELAVLLGPASPLTRPQKERLLQVSKHEEPLPQPECSSHKPTSTTLGAGALGGCAATWSPSTLAPFPPQPHLQEAGSSLGALALPAGLGGCGAGGAPPEDPLGCESLDAPGDPEGICSLEDLLSGEPLPTAARYAPECF